MVESHFVRATTPQNADAILTDDHRARNEHCINILVANASSIPEFKGIESLEGFHHYVIFHEPQFLEKRVKKALLRHRHLHNNTSLIEEEKNLTGVQALLQPEEVVHSSGVKFPIIRSFDIKSSRVRTEMAEKLERFFDEIEPFLDSKNPTLVQYAVEVQEELLMNAIWDANPKYADKPRSLPVELNSTEEVKLEWAFDGSELAISVKDNFGRLDPGIMNKYINFIFKTGKKAGHKLEDQKVSAGLGIFMILQRANLLSVFISHGRITDVGVVLLLGKSRRTKGSGAKAIDIINV